MLSPEIWNFPVPSFSLSKKICHFDGDVFDTVKKQLFNHHISITLPNSMQPPDELLKTLIDDSEYYRVNNVPAEILLDKVFIQFFVQKGRLTLFSVNAVSSNGDQLAVTPNGQFIFSLRPKTYQEFGVQGSSGTKHEKYNTSQNKLVILDIVLMKPNKVDETQKKLKHLNLIFDVILVWEPCDDKICPSTIAYFFSKKGFEVKTCRIKYQQKLSYNVDVPLICPETDEYNFMEWLGVFNLKCNLSDNKYISEFLYSEPTKKIGQVFHASLSGLFTVTQLEKLISETRKLIQEKETLPWMAIVINGFENSVLSVKNGKNFQAIGDNHHTLVFKANEPTTIYFYSSP